MLNKKFSQNWSLTDGNKYNQTHTYNNDSKIFVTIDLDYWSFGNHRVAIWIDKILGIGRSGNAWVWSNEAYEYILLHFTRVPTELNIKQYLAYVKLKQIASEYNLLKQ